MALGLAAAASFGLAGAGQFWGNCAATTRLGSNMAWVPHARVRVYGLSAYAGSSTTHGPHTGEPHGQIINAKAPPPWIMKAVCLKFWGTRAARAYHGKTSRRPTLVGSRAPRMLGAIKLSDGPRGPEYDGGPHTGKCKCRAFNTEAHN